MSKTELRRKYRETLLLDWFREGRYSLNQVIEMLNGHLLGKNEKSVSNRTVDLDIRRIKDQLKLNGEKLVYYNCKYRVVTAQGTQNSITYEEKLMVPLIQKLLEPYLIIPGINRLMDDIKSEHISSGIDGVVLKNSVAFTSPHFVMNEQMQGLIMKLLQCMFKGQACVFNYTDVHKRTQNARHEVYPLQIREDQGRLYLAAFPVDKEINSRYIRIYTLDGIRNRDIQTSEEYYKETLDKAPLNHSKYSYNYAKLLQDLNYANYFQGVIGVWRSPTVEPQIIKRYFAGWALSHIKAAPLHPSQQELETTDQVSTRHLEHPQVVGLIQWKIHRTPELAFRLGSYRDYSWAHHFGIHGPDERLNWDFELT